MPNRIAPIGPLAIALRHLDAEPRTIVAAASVAFAALLAGGGLLLLNGGI